MSRVAPARKTVGWLRERGGCGGSGFDIVGREDCALVARAPITRTFSLLYLSHVGDFRRYGGGEERPRMLCVYSRAEGAWVG